MTLRISPTIPGHTFHTVPPKWSPMHAERSSISVRVPPLVHGSRRVTMGTRNHNTSVVVDPIDFKAKALESSIEHKAFLVASADPKVVDIVCQAPPVEYVDCDGVVHQTIFDFVITLKNGTRRAVMVKSADKVRRAKLEDLAALIASQLPDGFADCVQLVTEEDLPAWQVSNARLIHSARLDPHCHIDDVIGARAESLFEPISIADLVSPYAPRGFRSVARLIFAGRLRQVRPGMIEPATLVAASGNRA